MRERMGSEYLRNPLHLFRGLASIALSAASRIDDAIADLGDFNDTRPYNETNYPPITHVEAPAEFEEDLLWAQDY